MKRKGGGGRGGEEGVELSELERSGSDGDDALSQSGNDDKEDQVADDKLELGMRARLFNKTNSTVCLLWHVIPMIVMVYAFLYIGTPPPPEVKIFFYSYCSAIGRLQRARCVAAEVSGC
jgi:hypothetical protein